MLETDRQGSKIARLLRQITAEYEAAQQGLTGLSFGMSQHEFITAKMERMEQIHNELHLIVGDAAIALIADKLDTIGSDTANPSVS